MGQGLKHGLPLRLPRGGVGCAPMYKEGVSRKYGFPRSLGKERPGC